MPCQCRGVAHTQCFGQWMVVQGNGECEVCLTRFYPVHTPAEYQQYYLLYNFTFGVIYYVVFALAAACYWITNATFVSVQQRWDDVLLFAVIVLCIHPVLVTAALVALTLQHYALEPAAEDSATRYSNFLQRRGSKV